MRSLNWLWVAVAALSFIAGPGFAQEQTETQTITIEYTTDGPLNADTKAKISQALSKKMKFAVQENTDGVRQIIMSQELPSDSQAFTQADLVALMMRGNVGAPDEQFDAKSEDVAKWALAEGFEPAAKLLQNSIARQMNLDPNLFDARVDFYNWVKKNDIHKQAKAFGHIWFINGYGKPGFTIPGVTKVGFQYLTRINAVDAEGNMVSTIAYSKDGFVEVVAKVGEEPKSAEEEQVPPAPTEDPLGYVPTSDQDEPVTHAGADLPANGFQPEQPQQEPEQPQQQATQPQQQQEQPQQQATQSDSTDSSANAGGLPSGEETKSTEGTEQANTAGPTADVGGSPTSEETTDQSNDNNAPGNGLPTGNEPQAHHLPEGQKIVANGKGWRFVNCQDDKCCEDHFSKTGKVDGGCEIVDENQSPNPANDSAGASGLPNGEETKSTEGNEQANTAGPTADVGSEPKHEETKSTEGNEQSNTAGPTADVGSEPKHEETKSTAGNEQSNTAGPTPDVGSEPKHEKPKSSDVPPGEKKLPANKKVVAKKDAGWGWYDWSCHGHFFLANNLDSNCEIIDIEPAQTPARSAAEQAGLTPNEADGQCDAGEANEGQKVVVEEEVSE